MYKCRDHGIALPVLTLKGESDFDEGDAGGQTPGDMTPTRETVVKSTPVPGSLPLLFVPTGPRFQAWG
jgi:hypothetical protein